MAATNVVASSTVSDWRHLAPRDADVNPYQARRIQLEAQKKGVAPAPVMTTQGMPALPPKQELVAAEPPAAPLRVTIPNVQSLPHAASPAMAASEDAPAKTAAVPPGSGHAHAADTGLLQTMWLAFLDLFSSGSSSTSPTPIYPAVAARHSETAATQTAQAEAPPRAPAPITVAETATPVTHAPTEPAVEIKPAAPVASITVAKNTAAPPMPDAPLLMAEASDTADIATAIPAAEPAPVPERLAGLAPKAGAPDNNTPLIQLPADNPPPATTAVTPPVTTAPATTVAAPATAAAPAQPTPLLAPATAVPAPTVVHVAPAAPVAVAVTPAVAATPAPATEKPLVSEPAAQLSPESKQILNKLPSNLDHGNKSGSEPFSIERSSDKPDMLHDDGAQAVRHESMGIKIEVKHEKINLNHELEKAYDALIAGETSTAAELYKNILANDPKNTQALFGLATLYHRAGQLEQARPLYGKILALEPGNRDALNNFLVLLGDEAPQEALTQLQQLARKNPKFSPIPAQMAIIYEKLGDHAQASEQMVHAIELAPENIMYRYNLAIMLDQQGKWDEAAPLYQQIIAAYGRGETLPVNIQDIQQRLTFIGSNRSR